ncbi:MAG: hypothetical protein PHO00_04130 [bacterium]|nr:hypothetical protein [bacterium]
MKRFMNGAMVFLMVAAFPCVLTAGQYLWEGFEGGIIWVPVEWENTGGAELSKSSEQVSEGKSALKIDIIEEAEDWREKVGFSREDYLNLEGVKVIMDIYCPYPFGYSVSLGFDTGPEWVYYETPRIVLSQGWNKDVTFDMSKDDFKCKASSWQYNQRIEDKNSVKKIHILIYRPAKLEPQVIYVDNIRFSK